MDCCKCKEYSWEKTTTALLGEDGRYYCILHAPKALKAKFQSCGFDETIEKLIHDSLASNYSCDLRGVVFDRDLKIGSYSETGILPHFDFEDAEFCFSADFSSVTFSSGADFSNTVFSREAIFENTHFDSEVTFQSATFSRGADFDGAQFKSDVSFAHINVERCLLINNVTFESSVTFLSANIFGITHFENTNFEDVTSFSNATFDGMFSMNKNNFLGNLEFVSTNFKQQALISDASISLHGADFTAVVVGGCLSLSFKNINGIIHLTSFISGDNSVILCDVDIDDMNRIMFSRATIRCLEFLRCKFPEQLYVEQVARNKKDFTTAKDAVCRFNGAEEFYRSLKQKAAIGRDQPMVSRWHYREKLMALEQIKQTRGWRSILSVTWLYYACSGFGEKPVKAFWFLAGLFGVALLVLCGFKLWETSWSPYPAWNKIFEIFAETLALIPLVKSGVLVDPANASILVPIKKFCVGFMQIAVSVQIALFAFALRNSFRR